MTRSSEIPDFHNLDKERVQDALNGKVAPDEVIEWQDRVAAADPEQREAMLQWLETNMGSGG